MMIEYWEVVIEGSEETVDEFLDWLANDHQIFREEDLALPPEDLAERLRHFIGADSRHRVYVATSDLTKLEAALPGHSGASLRLTSRRRAPRGHFGFEAKAFSAEVATAIRSALAERPREIELTGVHEDEELDPTARSAELYSPAHDFELHIDGVLTGPIPHLLVTRTRLAEIDFVHLGPLEITG